MRAPTARTGDPARAAANADEAVPTAHDAVQGHEPLAHCQGLTAVRVCNANLRQASAQGGWSLDMVQQALKAGRE